MNVILNEEKIQNKELIELMKKAGELCLAMEGVSGDDSTEVDVSFVSPEEIRHLNREYRNKDTETDVLSFPQYDNLADVKAVNGFLCLGDVIICPDIAAVQAEEYNHSFEREMVYLMVHSVLHLLGYDHMDEEEKDLMRQKEEEVMKQVGLTRE